MDQKRAFEVAIKIAELKELARMHILGVGKVKDIVAFKSKECLGRQKFRKFVAEKEAFAITGKPTSYRK